MPNFIAEYSVWNPPTSSCSDSGRSNGSRFVSANRADQEQEESERLAKIAPDVPVLPLDDPFRSSEPVIRTIPRIDIPIGIS